MTVQSGAGPFYTSLLLLSLVAFLLFMVFLLLAVGFGMGTVELAIWLVLVGGGLLLIVRRYRSARASVRRADRAG